MSITGGGGFGPKGPRPAGAKQGVSRRAADRRKASEAAVKAEKDQGVAGDAFEIGGGQRVLGDSTLPTPELPAETADIFGQIDRVSQANDVVAAFEERNALLTHQFEGFRERAQTLVDQVARAGFNTDAIKASRTDLDELRGQMAQVRGRIARNNRRIKFLQSSAYNLPRYDTGRLRRQTGKVAQAAAGIQRGAGTVSMAGDVVQDKLPNDQGITRLPLGGGAAIDRHALGSYVSQIAPTTMLSRYAVGLVVGGKDFDVKAPVSSELSGLHGDIRSGRAGKDLEELARFADLGGKPKI